MSIWTPILVLLAMKGASNKETEQPQEPDIIIGADEVEELFDLPFLERYAEELAEEETESETYTDNASGSFQSEQGLDADDDRSWEEMRRLYGDIEEMLLVSMEKAQGTDESEHIFVHEEGVIGLPVKPNKSSLDDQQVISLMVKQQGVGSDGSGMIINLPTKPMKRSEEISKKEIIELPTKPVKATDEKDERGAILLSGVEEENEDAVTIDISRTIAEEQDGFSIVEKIAKRALLKRPSGEIGGGRKEVSLEELERLEELRKRQREAIRKRLQERKNSEVSWGELIEAKETRTKRLDALRKKRKSRRTKKRKEKLHRLKRKERKERKEKKGVAKIAVEPAKEKAPPVREIRGAPKERRYPTLDRALKDDAAPVSGEIGGRMAVPPKEDFRGAPVVPGVTFAAIKRCPVCGGFVNLGVSNKCYTCGKVF